MQVYHPVMRKFITVAVTGMLLISAPAYAHSGRTNAAGCHNEKKTGGYHCHNAASSAKTTKTKARKTVQSSSKTTTARSSQKLADPICTSDRYNCADLGAQGEAQRVYEFCFKKVKKDIHRLDGDKDGVACES